jgi:hypothetical protein
MTTSAIHLKNEPSLVNIALERKHIADIGIGMTVVVNRKSAQKGSDCDRQYCDRNFKQPMTVGVCREMVIQKIPSQNSAPTLASMYIAFQFITYLKICSVMQLEKLSF